MRKIINPCICKTYKGSARAFCKIEYTDGRLSISGVVGPMNNGDRKGSAGQCVDAIRNGTPVKGWDAEMLRKFCAIWDEWHLNDMHPECEHQRELGWKTIARKEVSLYHYTMNDESIRKRREAEKAALDALRNGETFSPDKEQTFYAAMPYEVTLSEDVELPNYKKRKPLYNGDRGFEEKKTLGWLRPNEHPDGILCKPCPVCGYRYGTEWKTVEVPKEILDWLFALPETETQPAWV